MFFNSSLFIAFFTLFFVVFHFVAHRSGQKIWVVLFGSLFFYGCFDYRFLPILVGMGIITFWVGRKLGATTNDRVRKWLVVLGIAPCLAALGFFKYVNFFLTNLFGLLHLCGIKGNTPLMHVALPIGISFYTFQAISYVVDIYRGSMQPTARVRDVLASLSYFPHIVSGPIDRPSMLIPQLQSPTPPTWQQVQKGFLLLAFGLLKKNIADVLGGSVGALFVADAHFTRLEAWSGAIAYAGQLYCDFSGYTDMAIGAACLLGVDLTPNFRLPYLAVSPVDFWKRWHISLSSWLHDYLYLPLWMSCRSPYLSLIVTWSLAGLWHGAQWTFVAYGGYHGLLLIGTTMISRHAPLALVEWAGGALGRALTTVLTFYFITIGFVIFRAPTISAALNVVRHMHVANASATPTPGALAGLQVALILLIVTHLLDYLALSRMDSLRRPLIFWPVTVASFTLCFAFGGNAGSFIYQAF